MSEKETKDRVGRVAATRVITLEMGEDYNPDGLLATVKMKVELLANGEPYIIWRCDIIYLYAYCDNVMKCQAKIYWTLKSEPEPDAFKYN